MNGRIISFVDEIVDFFHQIDLFVMHVTFDFLAVSMMLCHFLPSCSMAEIYVRWNAGDYLGFQSISLPLQCIQRCDRLSLDFDESHSKRPIAKSTFLADVHPYFVSS